jgi:hypothetical protein
MPTASPVAAIAKLSEELIALEDKYGARNTLILNRKATEAEVR